MGEQATLNAGTGNDFINLYHSTSTNNGVTTYHLSSKSIVNAGGGNDTIYNNYSGDENVTINAGAGNDYILNSGKYAVLNVDSGNDTISLGSSHLNNLIQYTKGDGNDTIYGYNNTDTIQIIGSSYTTQNSGSDVLISVGDGSMLLKDVNGTTLNIITVEGGEEEEPPEDLISVNLTNKDSSPYTAASNVGTVDGAKGKRTKAVELNGNDYDNVLIGGTGKDTINGGAGDDELTGGKQSDIFIYDGKGNDVITDYAYASSNYDSIQIEGISVTGVEYTGESETDLVFTFDNGETLTVENAVKLKSSRGKITRVLPPQKVRLIINGEDQGAQVYGEGYADTINVVNADGGTIIANADAEYINAAKRTTAVNLIGNAKNNTIVAGSKNDTLDGGAGSDDLLAGKGGKDIFIYGGGHDTISDYTAGQDSITVSKEEIDITNYKISNKDIIYEIDEENSLTLVNALNKTATINGETIRLIDYEHITLTNTDTSPYEATDTRTKSVNATKRTKPIEIIGNANDNTITGGTKNDTLRGGKGDDTFVYTAGKGADVITDYNANESGEADIVQLGKGTYISKAKVSGNDYVFTFNGKAANKLTIQGGATKEITFIDEDENELIYKARKKAKASSYVATTVDEPWFSIDDNFDRNDISTVVETTEPNYGSSEIVDTKAKLTDLTNDIQTVTYNAEDKKAK